MLAALAGAATAQQPAAGGEALPPAGIAGLDARPAMPLEFSHAWLGKAAAVRRRRAELHARGELSGRTPAALAAEGAALAGTLRIPVIAVRYSDVPAPYPATELAARLFGAASADTMSMAAFWQEVSAGLLRVEGIVTDWVPLAHAASHYLPTDGYGWARFGRMRDLREEVLRDVDGSIDFRQFDNDGPDGIPNSGDDDGFVDFVAFFYATSCDLLSRAGAIWPHRGAMKPFYTNDRGAGGERIGIADYVVLPALDARTCGAAHIGLIAHEVAHAFGLPDLYDYDGSSSGVGHWGLMGTGSHASPHSPAHPGAWAKEQLGWAEVRWLDPAGGAIELPAVELEPVVYRYDLRDGHGRYLLFENRQRLRSDRDLPGHGLLVWQVDPERGELGAWNADERRPAVGLLTADARGRPRRARGSDPADPLPGLEDRRRLELDEVRLSRIAERNGRISAQVAAMPAPGPVVAALPVAHLTSPADGPPVERRVRVEASRRWVALASSRWLELRVEGDTLLLSADAAGLPPGVHRDTVSLLPVAGPGKAARLPVVFEVLEPGVARVIAEDLPWSWGLAARGGDLAQASYGWSPFALRPRPRLLHIADGAPHPETLSKLPAEALYAPVLTPDGSTYVLARARGQNYLYRVAPDGDAEVIAARFGKGPAYGATLMPDGALVVATWAGELLRIDHAGAVRRLLRAARRFYQVSAGPAGELYVTTLDGELLRRAPDGSVSAIPTGLDRGRVVAVAAAPDGRVYVGERGGAGRIMEVGPVRGTRTIARVPGAEFYGLAVDGRLLYALDLAGRRLLRIPLADGAPTLVAEVRGPSPPPASATVRALAPPR